MKRIINLLIVVLLLSFISNVNATYTPDKQHSVLKKGEVIYFDATGLDWQHVYIHIWEKDGDVYKDWASNDEMTKVEGTDNIYAFMLPDSIDEKYNMIIFHNEYGGSANQTISLGHLAEGYAYIVDGYSDGKRIGYWHLYDKSDYVTRLNTLKQYQVNKGRENAEWEDFFDGLKALYAGAVYGTTEGRPHELSYARCLKFLLQGQGFRVMQEVENARGRTDIVADHPCGTYVFELKVDKPPKLAMSQIQRRKYAAPYRAAGKPVWAVGLSFDGKTRQFKGGVAEAVK